MRMQRLARLLMPHLMRIAETRAPNFQLYREDGETYLRRWWIWPRNSYINLYLHNMIGSDDDVLHDHPYWSISLVLTNGLRERYVRYPGWWGTASSLVRRFRLGDVVIRSSTFAHQLIVDEPAWTLFLTGPRIREWGFWCPKGWLHWEKYHPEQASSAGSGTFKQHRGCGELS